MNPNFDHLEEGLNTVHVELGRVRNIPGLNVNQQFNDMRRAMDEGFRRLGQAILTAYVQVNKLAKLSVRKD